MIDLSNRYGEALKWRYRAFTKGSKNGTLYQPRDVARQSRERPENDDDEGIGSRLKEMLEPYVYTVRGENRRLRGA